jgi:hypothetical protein
MPFAFFRFLFQSRLPIPNCRLPLTYDVFPHMFMNVAPVLSSFDSGRSSLVVSAQIDSAPYSIKKKSNETNSGEAF